MIACMRAWDLMDCDELMSHLAGPVRCAVARFSARYLSDCIGHFRGGASLRRLLLLVQRIESGCLHRQRLWSLHGEMSFGVRGECRALPRVPHG